MDIIDLERLVIYWWSLNTRHFGRYEHTTWTLRKADKKMKFQLSELEELRLDAYESQRHHKAPTKLYHDKFMLCRSIRKGGPNVDLLVGLERARKIPQWLDGAYTVTKVFSHGAINGQHVKHC